MTVHYDGPAKRGGRLRLQTREYKGREFTDIRRWTEQPDGSLRPTTDGVTLPREADELRRIGEAFLAAADLASAGGAPA
jgi:hypothetical protein